VIESKVPQTMVALSAYFAARTRSGNVDGHAVAADEEVFRKRSLGDSRAPYCSVAICIELMRSPREHLKKFWSEHSNLLENNLFPMNSIPALSI
jgi:hypothetical protein